MAVGPIGRLDVGDQAVGAQVGEKTHVRRG
jgi:hypothetical protein